MNTLAAKEEPYVKRWNLFLKKSGYTKAMTDFVEEIATHVSKKIAVGNPVFRVLGVGSGKGKTDLRILTGISNVLGQSHQMNMPSIHSVIVEPSQEMISEFKAATTPLPQSLVKSSADVTFEWCAMTLEKFIESFPKVESFNIIHFVASLYYMDAELSLRSCYQKLSPGGAMFCTVVPEESFFPQISKKLHTKVDLGSAQKLYSEEDVVDIAARNNWRYEKLWKAQYIADITSCFDESSKEGGILLDFLTHQGEFRTTADKISYQEAMDFLGAVSATDGNGRKIIRPEMTAVVIYK